MAKYEENNPVFQVLTKAVHEVILCYNTMPNAYRIMFGRTICQEIGECGTYLNETIFQKNPSTMIRKLEVADHHLQNVKFWVNQAPNMSFIAKDGIVKYSIPLERSACCSKTLKELGCLIGGWQSTLYDRKGGTRATIEGLISPATTGLMLAGTRTTAATLGWGIATATTPGRTRTSTLCSVCAALCRIPEAIR